MRSLAFALAAAFAWQQPAQPPTFRAATDLVEVDVSAVDRNGQFVGDLRAGDFEIREEGSTQRIELMYVVRGGTATPAGTGASVADAGTIAPSPTLPTTRRVFVALFDNDHLSVAAFKRSQAAALELFSKHFGAGDVGGVVVDRHLAHDRLTSDREELLADVRAARPGQTITSRQFDERMWPRLSAAEAVEIVLRNDQRVKTAAIERACSEQDCNNPVTRQLAELGVASKATQLTTEAQAEASKTLQTTQVLLRGLGRIDGRKTVLLLTEGFIADLTWPLVKEAVGEAARVNARIYTLDARGLDRRGMADYLTTAFPGDSSGALNLLKQFDITEDGMNSLAVDTGGFVVRNQNYFDQAVAQIVADASTYYVLAYRPEKAPDGKYRSISVKVKRPGVLIRARRGYVAAARPAPVPTMTAAAPVPAAAAAPAMPASPEPAPVEPEPTAASAPVPTPEPVVTNASPSQGFRFRPDAGKHVDLLLKDESADAAAKTGWDAYQRGDVATARASLSLAAASASAHPWVHYALGLSEYALRQFRESASEWEIVRRAEPSFEPVYFDLVDSYLQLREHDEAIKVLRAARDRWPKDPEVYNALGVLQTTRGVIDDAVKAFEEAVKLAPKDAVSQFNLGRALEMRYNRSRRYVQQLRQWVSNDRDRTEAIDHYNACIALGGPFAQQAQEGLARLNWKASP